MVEVGKANPRLDSSKIHNDFPKIDEDYAAWYRLVMKGLLSTDKKVENTGTIVESHVHVGARGVSPINANKDRIIKARRARKEQKTGSYEISDGDGVGGGAE